MLRILLALAILAALPVSAQTVSDAAVQRRNVPVRRDDLDLRRESDARQMLARLAQAADRACGGRPTSNLNPAARALEADYRRCRDTALVTAAASLNSPIIDRLLAERTNVSSPLARR